MAGPFQISNAPSLAGGIGSSRGEDEIFKKIKQTQIQSSSHLRLVSPKFTCCLSLMRVPHPHTQFCITTNTRHPVTPSCGAAEDPSLHNRLLVVGG